MQQKCLKTNSSHVYSGPNLQKIKMFQREKVRLTVVVAVCATVCFVVSFYFNQNQYPSNKDFIWHQLRSAGRRFNCSKIPDLFGEDYVDNLKLLSDELAGHNLYLSSVIRDLKGKDKARCMEGHVAKYMEEAYMLWQLAKLDQVKVICETGFNVGHSTLIWLLAKPSTIVYSFDLRKHSCSLKMAEYLQKRFPGRLHVTWGDSTQTLPDFRGENPRVICDLMSVDGGHTPAISKADMDNFMMMSNRRRNLVLLDNHPDKRYQLNVTWEGAVSDGLLEELFRCSYEPRYTTGFTLGRYIFS